MLLLELYVFHVSNKFDILQFYIIFNNS